MKSLKSHLKKYYKTWNRLYRFGPKVVCVDDNHTYYNQFHYYRPIRTKQERTANRAFRDDLERGDLVEIAPKVKHRNRARINYDNLPTNWDDIYFSFHHGCRSWKDITKKRKQWMKHKKDVYDPAIVNTGYGGNVEIIG